MFKTGATIQTMNERSKNSMVEHLGIEFTEVGSDFVKARMPVDNRTIQPFGILHGGASVTLAETLGSWGATFTLDPKKQYCVGLDINANHIRSMTSGYVEGVAKPLHIGRRTQVWEIRIVNDEHKLVSICRLTMAILDKE